MTTMIIGGDLFPTEKNMKAFQDGDIHQLFDESIIRLFNEADYSVCNLEGCLTDSLQPIRKCDPKIRAPRSAVLGIRELGPSCIALANNHIMDYDTSGYLDTMNTLEENGFETVGSGRDENSIKKHISVDSDDGRVAIYNVAETMFNEPGEDRPGVNLYDEYRVCREIQELKETHDRVIVLYHGGVEFFWYTSKLLRKRFHRMADSGADVVLAQHTHNIGPRETYNGAYLNYGQGDFLFATSVSDYKESGLLIEIIFDQEDMTVREHLLRHEGGRAFRDSEQDMSAAEERSRRLVSGDESEAEYSAYCDQQMDKFLRAFRGDTFIDKVMHHLLPAAAFHRYLKRRYKEKQILRMISAVRFEEFNDIVFTGLQKMLDEER